MNPKSSSEQKKTNAFPYDTVAHTLFVHDTLVTIDNSLFFHAQIYRKCASICGFHSFLRKYVRVPYGRFVINQLFMPPLS